MTTDPLVIAAAVLVGVLSAARLTRLIVDDEWPPTVWLAAKYRDAVPDNWKSLVDCAACAAPWMALPVLAWGLVSDLHWTWWVFNGWLAGSYIATMIVWRDYPNGEAD